MSSTPTQPGADFNGSLIANRYQIRQKLGKGTYGEVFLADDLKFNPPRAVAIKMLHSKFLNEAEVRADIEREASVLARFSHANILRVIDFDISETQAFIVTELAEGGSLARKIRPDPLQPPVRMPLEEVGWYLEQLTDALDEAHQAGLIHRDLKPLNILLNKRGRPLIADFGLATAVSSSQSSVLVDTQTSGTPPYMAPEQWMGHAGRASDIYAMGIITFQLITGELPYQGGHFELMGQHLNAPIPRLSERGAPGLAYPPTLDNVMLGVLAKDPRQRTHSALEFYRNFRNAIMPFPSPSGSIDSYPIQSGPTGPLNFQGQPFQPSPPTGSNPPGTGPYTASNQLGSTPPGGFSQQPQTGSYQTGPLPGPNRGMGFNPSFSPPSPNDATRQANSGPIDGLTAPALPNSYSPETPMPGPGQPGINQTVILKTGPVQTKSRMNPGLIAGVAVITLLAIIGVVAGLILFTGGKSSDSTPTQAVAIAASPTGSASPTTAAATGTDTPSDTATPEPTTPEATTEAPTTAAPSVSGQSVIARQGSLRKVAVSDSFVKSAIQGVSSNASSNTTLQILSSSEAPDKVKTELDNGLAQANYNYTVPEPHKSPPSDFYGGYSKDGAPDLVYVILDSTNLAEVLKSNGVDDASIAKIASDTKGQQSVVFSYEGTGFVNTAFAPDPTTATPSYTTSAAGTAGPSQTVSSTIPIYTGAVAFDLPATVISEETAFYTGSPIQNFKIQAYKVTSPDAEIKKFFDAYMVQAGWTDVSSELSAETVQSFKDSGVITAGPYTKGQEIVLIVIGKGKYAAELTGVPGSTNVYTVVRGNT